MVKAQSKNYIFDKSLHVILTSPYEWNIFDKQYKINQKIALNSG